MFSYLDLWIFLIWYNIFFFQYNLNTCTWHDTHIFASFINAILMTIKHKDFLTNL